MDTFYISRIVRISFTESQTLLGLLLRGYLSPSLLTSSHALLLQPIQAETPSHQCLLFALMDGHNFVPYLTFTHVLQVLEHVVACVGAQIAFVYSGSQVAIHVYLQYNQAVGLEIDADYLVDFGCVLGSFGRFFDLLKSVYRLVHFLRVQFQPVMPEIYKQFQLHYGGRDQIGQISLNAEGAQSDTAVHNKLNLRVCKLVIRYVQGGQGRHGDEQGCGQCVEVLVAIALLKALCGLFLDGLFLQRQMHRFGGAGSELVRLPQGNWFGKLGVQAGGAVAPGRGQ